jgi:short-subunit dehydrogenase
MNKIKDTVWWITGASSGIGKSLVFYILKNGGKVILSSRNKNELLKIVNESRAAENNYLVLPLDLENIENSKELVNTVINKFSRIDYLINNGGISQRSIVSETPIEIDRKVMEINFFGTVALTKAVLPIMIKQQSGHIAVVSSVVGKFGFPLRSAYSASKHALHGFFESLRAENINNNIKVSVVIPGRINTLISNNSITKDGSKHGKLDEGQANSMSPEKAAPIIINGVLKEKKEVLVGGKELLMVHFRRWIPSLFYYLSNKVSAK